MFFEMNTTKHISINNERPTTRFQEQLLRGKKISTGHSNFQNNLGKGTSTK